MNLPSRPMLYIRFRKRIALKRNIPIHLGDVAQLLCDSAMEEKLKKLILLKPESGDGNLILIDMMHVIRMVRTVQPDIQFELFGEPHVLIELVEDKRKPNLLFVIIVWLILFIGAGLAIMNFHADVSMAVVHQRIYQLLTGKTTEHPYMLQISYSLGIGIGMVLFFNHLFKKKFNEEPSPLEVDMFLYQESTNHFVITEEYRKLAEKGNDRGDNESNKGRGSG